MNSPLDDGSDVGARAEVDEQAERKAKAEEATTKAALELFARPCFPAELRAMVTTVLVRDRLPHLYLRGKYKYHHLTTSPATALLNTEALESLDKDSRETIEQAVDDAVFKIALFTPDLKFRRKDGALSLISPPFLQGKESTVRYLNAVVTLDVDGWAKNWQMDFSRATENMRLVKMLFPNLKHCVLTVRIIGPSYLRESFLPEVLALRNSGTSTHPTTVKRELVTLLETFAKEAPGTRRSVCMRYHTGGVLNSKSETEWRGPLAHVEENEGLGEKQSTTTAAAQKRVGNRLLTATYRIR